MSDAAIAALIDNACADCFLSIHVHCENCGECDCRDRACQDQDDQDDESQKDGE